MPLFFQLRFAPFTRGAVQEGLKGKSRGQQLFSGLDKQLSTGRTTENSSITTFASSRYTVVTQQYSVLLKVTGTRTTLKVILKKIMNPAAFDDLPDELKEQLRFVTTRYFLDKKESLYPLQSPPVDLIFVEEGWVALSMHDTVITILRPQESYFGPVLRRGTVSECTVTLTALTPTNIFTIKRNDLMRILAGNPLHLQAIHDEACERMNRAHIQIARSQTDSLEIRMASFLWNIGAPQKDGCRYVPPLSQSILALCLGTAREEVNRKKKSLLDMGYLKLNGKDLFVTEVVGEVLAERGYGE